MIIMKALVYWSIIMNKKKMMDILWSMLSLYEDILTNHWVLHVFCGCWCLDKIMISWILLSSYYSLLKHHTETLSCHFKVCSILTKLMTPEKLVLNNFYIFFLVYHDLNCKGSGTLSIKKCLWKGHKESLPTSLHYMQFSRIS